MLTIESLQTVCKTQNGKQQSVILPRYSLKLCHCGLLTHQHVKRCLSLKVLHIGRV